MSASHYRRADLAGGGTHGAVIALYDGALRQLRRAANGFEPKTSRRRAVEAVAELTASLDPAAGSIAHDLAALYTYLTERLLLGGEDAIDEAIGLLEPLRAAFAEVRDR